MKGIDWDRLKEIFLAFSSILLITCLILIVVQWGNLKGTYLIKKDGLEKTVGTIVASEIRPQNSKNGMYYHYDVQYVFQVEGKKYTSDKITFSHTGTHDGQLAEEYIEKYPVGKIVTVFYETDDPSFSALEPEVKNDEGKYVLTALAGFSIIWLWAFYKFVESKWRLRRAANRFSRTSA